MWRHRSFRGEQNEIVPEAVGDSEIGWQAIRCTKHSDIKRIRLDLFQDRNSRLVGDRDSHFWMVPAVCKEESGKVGEADGAGNAGANELRGIGEFFADPPDRRVHVTKDVRRLPQEKLAGRRECQAARRALEKSYAETLLDSLNLARDRALREPGRGACPGKRTSIGDQMEQMQLKEIEGNRL